MGVVIWVVDTTKNSLVSFGYVGELLFEGPPVNPGYLNPELTTASFVHDSSWLLRGFNLYTGRRGRLYKTDNLVRYNYDGTLLNLEQKNNQIKINKQRIKLYSLLHRARGCYPYNRRIYQTSRQHEESACGFLKHRRRLFCSTATNHC